jgi:hypothetical protein
MGKTRTISLVYASEGMRPLAEHELDELLAGSRSRNSRVGLTGMLLYKDGAFMQALEGDEKAIRRTFRRISRDKRHGAIRVLSSTDISVRQFGEWSMGYRRVTEDAPAITPGFDDFLSRGDLGPSWSASTPARVLLDWFRLHAGQETASAPPALYTLR